MENTPLFSPREKQVVDLLLEGRSNKQIALALSISTSTVEYHLKNIYAELQVSTRTEAVLKLAKYPQWESTGVGESGNLRESIVGGMGEPADNGLQTSSWRLPMKTILFFTGGLIATALLAALFLARQPSQNVPVAPTATNAAGQPAATAIISPTRVAENPTSTPGVESCQAVDGLNFCLGGIARTAEATYIMLEIKTTAGVRPDMSGFMTSLNDAGPPVLRDETGREYQTLDGAQSLAVTSALDEQTFLQTLKFPALEPGAHQAALKFASVSVFVPILSSFQLDLGENPQGGDEISLDQRLNIHGQVINLRKAVFSGQGGSLQVELWSDPVELKDDIAGLMPALGIPPGTDMGTGFGSKMILPGSAWHVFANLSRPGLPPVSGLISVPLDGASVYYQGNFEIPISIPEAPLTSRIKPGLEQLTQIAEIRRFTKRPELEPVLITFEVVNNLWSAMYLTGDGSKYWLETRSNRITQYKPAQLSPGSQPVKSLQELEQSAQQFASQNSLKFNQLRDDLVGTVKIEGHAYIFRWEYQKMSQPETGSPFLLVSLGNSGEILEFANSLDFAIP
ncbi:MAG TPA: helix-turn-helix transcriptional regulator [Anaerolineales bacterium]|jgi:DNA-binding CsgD family transcriptional regulator